MFTLIQMGAILMIGLLVFILAASYYRFFVAFIGSIIGIGGSVFVCYLIYYQVPFFGSWPASIFLESFFCLLAAGLWHVDMTIATEGNTTPLGRLLSRFQTSENGHSEN